MLVIEIEREKKIIHLLHNIFLTQNKFIVIPLFFLLSRLIMTLVIKMKKFYCAVGLKRFDQNNKIIEREIHCNAHRHERHLRIKSFGSNKTNLIRHMIVHMYIAVQIHSNALHVQNNSH